MVDIAQKTIHLRVEMLELHLVPGTIVLDVLHQSDVLALRNQALWVGIRHHQDHRDGFLLRDEIVQNLHGPSAVDPSRLVAVQSVQKVKHGQLALTGGILRRCVDNHCPVFAVGSALEHYRVHFPLHLFVYVKVGLRSAADNEDAFLVVAHTDGVRIGRVGETCAVDIELVGVDLRRKRGRGVAPNAVFVALHFHRVIAFTFDGFELFVELTVED